MQLCWIIQVCPFEMRADLADQDHQSSADWKINDNYMEAFSLWIMSQSSAV